MADYFVSPREQPDWHIDPERFIANLQEHWPAATIQRHPNENYPYEWIIPMSHGRLQGFLDRQGQVIALHGDVRDCAELAVWVRSQVPATSTLIFYDEGFSAEVEVREGTPAKELIAPFLAR